MKARLATELGSHERSATLYSLSRAYWLTDLDSSFHFATVLLKHSEEIQDHAGIGNARNSMAVVEW
ncbi:MAG: hypothetical protein M3R08_09340, partial [Bacteroidota bacterium]|nr:hypothetical protein [Bacteroidota bacterium]